jgi:predicted phosphodiesterase
MRLAVLSDIHGNLEAFTAVLADLDGEDIDAVLCLGDSIGYGPDPEPVVELVRARAIPSLLGNHELGVVDVKFLPWFNVNAQASLLLTRQILTRGTLDYCRQLPRVLEFEGCLCVHGCPPDSVTTYLFAVNAGRLQRLFAAMAQDLCFVGHTHELELVGFDGTRVARARLTRGTVALDTAHRFIVNVGSVGQPRDGDNHAKYVIWDASRRRLEVRYVPYDIAATAAKIVARGFPRVHAERLW